MWRETTELRPDDLATMGGLPGNEKNLDLAQAIRRTGWNVVTMNYRGSWGSEGTFRFSHTVDDARAALAYLRDPGNAPKLRTDSSCIVVAGHRMGGWVAALTAARETAFGVILISAGDRAKQVHVATDHSWWTVGSGYPGKSSTGSRRFARRRADRRESVRGPDDEHDIRARTAAAHTNQERVDVKEADRLSFRPGPEYDSLMGIRHAFVLPLVVLGCVNSRHAEVRLANNPDGADCFTRCVQTTQGAASVDCVATCPGAHRDSGACSGGACVEERKISTSKSALLLIAVAAVALFAFGGGGGAE